MASYRYPVLVWEDCEHGFTAALLEDWDNTTAVAPSARAVLQQLEEYVTWQVRRSYFPEPDFLEPAMTWFSVPIRPVYLEGSRMYACEEVVTLRVPCVHGRQEGGMMIAAAPTLGVRFYYHAAERLKPLIEYHVKEQLGRVTPQQLSRFMPPQSLYLDEIVVRAAPGTSKREERDALPELTSVAEPLGDRTLRRQFSKPWERDREVEDLVRRLTKERANVILVGPGGSGKTAVLVEAVRRIEHEARRKDGGDGNESAHRYWFTQAGRLVAGMKYLGQWEERCETVIAELSRVQGTLCVDNLLDLLRVGGSGPGDSIAAFLMPYLQRGELHLVGECTAEELDACRRLLPGLADLFQILVIAPFEAHRALRVLQTASAALQQNTSIRPAKGVVEAGHRLFSRFRPYDAFPGKATTFLRDLYEDARRHRLDDIQVADAIAAFARQSGLPDLFLMDEKPLTADSVQAWFSERIIGQAAACQCATRLVTLFKAGLNDPYRPLGVLLFCGPTGVGKTELARALSQFFFGVGGDASERLIRLDMSEYSDALAAARLLGTQREPSELIKKIRRQPFSVVLFDEIEKAAPEVFDVLLSLFDEGRLADPYGRVTWFRSAIIIMTSNLGADLQEAVGFLGERTPSYQSEAMAFFRPEFFNRIDEVVTFQPLAPETIRSITVRELQALGDREGLKAAGLTLTWSPEVVELLAQKGFDKRYGARPLQRTIERLVIVPLSTHLVRNPKLSNAELRLEPGPDGEIIVRQPRA